MRKAYYYGSAVPPKDWLVYASLLWDKIWVGQNVKFLSETRADQMRSNSDGRFLQELLTKTTIIDVSDPVVDADALSEDEGERFHKYYEHANAVLEAMLAQPARDTPFDPPTYEEMVKVASLMNQAATPPWAQNAFRDLDYFFDSSHNFQECHSLNTTVLLTTIEAIIPKEPESIEMDKLIEFRENSHLQRLKFREEVDKLFEGLFESSTDEDLQRKVKLCEEYILEQLNILELNYRAYKIDAVKKAMGITFTGPALVGALSSLLHVPFYMPAAIVSAIAISTAEILLAIEKGKSEISKSPWGYLRTMKKL